MKKRSHKCGGCAFFLKIKGNFGNSGICEWHDARTNEHRCTHWKPIPYMRVNSKVGGALERKDGK